MLFISYTIADCEYVTQQLVPFLENEGIKCWYAEGDIQSAQRWEREILVALRQCEWFLVVCTPRSQKSEWVKNEVDWAMRHRLDRLIPLMVEHCQLEEFHLGLPRVHYIDVPARPEHALAEVVRVIAKGKFKSHNEQIPDATKDHSETLVRLPLRPFHCGQWVPPKFFIGREYELALAKSMLIAGQNFLVVGAARAGKTSFFRKLTDLMDSGEDKSLMCYLNLEQGIELSLKSFMEHTLLTILGEMARKVFGCRYSELLQADSKSIDKLKEDGDFTQFYNIFSLVTRYTHATPLASQEFLVHEFANIINDLIDIVQSRGVERIIAFYDEANRLPRDISMELLNNLGEALSETGLVGAYAAGPEMTNSFINTPGLAANAVHIGPFESIQELRQLISRYYYDELNDELTLPFNDEAIKRIWQYSDGIPYRIQLIANTVFQLGAKQAISVIGVTHVDQAYAVASSHRPEAFAIS